MRKKAFILSMLFLLVSITGCAGGQAEEPDNAINYEDNGLPVLYLEIDPQEFEEVNESPDHSYKAEDASIRITVPGTDQSGKPSTDTGSLELDYIRGRGHGTWAADKKPYRFKLKESADLLGMGRNKHWVLLANRYDVSMMRNRVAAYMGEQMGMPYVPQSRPVDLVVNGEYYGSYVLCEQVRIGENRIAIDQLDADDVEEPDVTGGYLLCLNPGYEEDAQNVFLTDRMVRFGVEEPQFSDGEAGTKEQKEYITSYVRNTEDAIFAYDLRDDSGVPYSEYMDLRSAADYWWIQEFTGNHDAFITSSTYLYKKRSGKLYWGPLWDFDLSLGDGLDSTEGFLHRNMIWLDHLRAHAPEYQELLLERWAAMEPVIDELIRDGGVIDQYKEEIRKSWEDDQLRWPVLDDDGEAVLQDLDAEADRMKTWIRQRRDWIRMNLDSELYHVYDTVTFMAYGRVCRTEEVLTGMPMDRLPQAPYIYGYVFGHWADEADVPYNYDPIEGDTVLHAVYFPQEETGITEGIFFVNPNDVWADLNSKQYDPVFELVPQDTIDKSIEWTSSDTDCAEVDEYGTVRLKKAGEVTIRAELRTGASNSFVLHIYDSETDGKQPLEQLTAEEDFSMQAGDYRQVAVSVRPANCDSDLQYRSSDGAVASVDDFGVVHAITPGEAIITVKDNSLPGVECNVKVTVQE